MKSLCLTLGCVARSEPVHVMIRFHLLLAILGCCALQIFAQEALPPLPDAKAAPPAEYIVECQMVAIPGKLLPSIVPELNDVTKVIAAVQKLQAMIARGEATLTAHLSARGLFEIKTVAESVEEVKTSTEFEYPAVPPTTPLAPALEVLKHWPHAGIVPTSFDTRNVGQRLEIEVARNLDPRWLSVSCALQNVRLEKMMKIDAGKLADGEGLFVQQPVFSSTREQFNTVFASGVPRLVGVHRLPEPPGMYELFIMTLRRTAGGISAAAAAPAAASGAVTLTDPAADNVQAELRIIAVPVTQALALVPRLRSPATYRAAELRVEALVVGGEAELVDWVQVQSGSGQKATTETITEIRYPTEWDMQGCFPPPPPSSFTQSILETLPGREKESGGFGIRINTLPNWFFEPFDVSSAYDTRNTGTTLEFEPQLNDDSGLIDVSIDARLVQFKGLERSIAGRPGPPTFRGYPMARFAEYHVQSNFPVARSGGALIGTFTLAEPAPRVLLFLFRATTPSPSHHRP